MIFVGKSLLCVEEEQAAEEIRKTLEFFFAAARVRTAARLVTD